MTIEPRLVDVEVDTDEERRVVAAEVYGSLAVHPSVPDTAGVHQHSPWTVTHVPTGRRIGRFKSKERAENLVRMALLQGVDWDFTERMPAATQRFLQSLKGKASDAAH